MTRAGAAVAALFLALACQTAGPSASDARAYHAAVRELARDRDAGLRALREFVAERPDSPLADDAVLRIADALVEQGRDREAIRRLERGLRAAPDGDRANDMRLLLARLLRADGRPASAYRVARHIRLSLLEGGRRVEVLRLLAELAEEAHDRTGRLRWLAKLRNDAKDPADAAQAQEALDAALGALSAAELDDAAHALGRAVPAASVRIRQAELALAGGDAERAEDLVARASELPLAGPDAERLAALEARLRGEAPPGAPAPGSAFYGTAEVQGTLGVVLPLSGELAAAGQEVLDGVLLASGVLEPAPTVDGAAPRGLRLRVRDSAGAPARAVDAVRELGADPAVLAIVGPLTQEEALAAAAESDALGVPLVTLTRHEAVAVGHPNVFRIGLTFAAETERLAEYAVSELGARRVGILHPEDAYGESMRALFTSALEARGGEVAAATGYAPDTKDFSAAARALIRAAGGQPAGDAPIPVPGPGEDAPPPLLDAVFLPDTYRVVGLAAPALAAAGLRGVRFLGTSGWNDPRLARVGREHVEGAVFTGAVVPESSTPMLREFAERFRSGFGRPPEALSAQGFDATLLLLREIVAGHATREGLRKGLLANGPLEGVSGDTDFEADGNARRRPHLLGVEDGRIVHVDALGRAPRLPFGAPLAPRADARPARALGGRFGAH